jgi:hypothetical protein
MPHDPFAGDNRTVTPTNPTPSFGPTAEASLIKRPTYLTSKEAAAYTRLTASTLAKLRCYGGGPTFMRVGRKIIYDGAVLDRWLATHGRANTSEISPQ